MKSRATSGGYVKEINLTSFRPVREARQERHELGCGCHYWSVSVREMRCAANEIKNRIPAAMSSVRQVERVK